MYYSGSEQGLLRPNIEDKRGFCVLSWNKTMVYTGPVKEDKRGFLCFILYPNKLRPSNRKREDFCESLWIKTRDPKIY